MNLDRPSLDGAVAGVRLLEKLDDRIVLSANRVSAAVFRPIDEVGNNVAHPNWGVGGPDLRRLSPADYTNGYNSPSLAQDPSPRLISDIVNNQADPADPSQDIATVNQQSLSALRRRLRSIHGSRHGFDPRQRSLDAHLRSGGRPDRRAGRHAPGICRIQHDPATGTGPGNPAQQVNSITSYLDLSQVYGSDQATDDALRTFVGGRMKTSPGGLPPLDNTSVLHALRSWQRSTRPLAAWPTPGHCPNPTCSSPATAAATKPSS